LGAQGGFVCGPGKLIEWLVNRCRPYIFSTALAPPAAAAARAALAIAEAEPERRQRLLALSKMLCAGLQSSSFPGELGGQSSQSHIVPVVVGDAFAATRLAAE